MDLLATLGVHETDRNLANKLRRDGFSAALMLQCLAAIGPSKLDLAKAMTDDVQPKADSGLAGSKPKNLRERIAHRLGFLAGRYGAYLDWRPYFLVIASAAAIWFSVYGYLQFREYQISHADERERAAAENTGQGRSKIDVECVGIAGSESLRCTGDTEESQFGDASAYYDLKAQQEMAEWAYSLLLLNVLGLVASATGIAFVYMNLVATRQIGQNQTRAFVYAASATLDLPKREAAPTNALTGNIWIGPPPFVYLRIANLGQTPAVQVETVARLILAQAGRTSEVPLELKEERNLDYVMKDAPQDLLFVLPADKLGVGARLSTVMQATNALLGGSMGDVEVTVAGTITYTDVFGERIQTDFHFRRRDDIKGGKLDMFPIHGKSRMFRKVGRAK